MELFWYILISVVLAIFFILDGYDFGVGIIHLFIPKSEKDKELVAKSAGLFWDSNEVWLVAGGGMLFMAFPSYYASVFSGFYLPLVLVLWLIILRAIGLELRSQFSFSMWKAIWDKVFGISSLLLALFFGVGLGNIMRGVNLGGVENGVSAYEPIYFFLPLWSSDFSPYSNHPGVLDWFTVIIGVISVVTLAIHGANWIVLKTNSSINTKLKPLVFKLNILLLVLTIFSLFVFKQINSAAFNNFIETPAFLVFPIVFFVGIIGLFFIHKLKKDIYSFMFSSMIILGGITTSLASIFPVVLPSTNNINESLSIYNTQTSVYGFSVALPWCIVGIILIIFYFIFQRRFLSGKIDAIKYGH